MTVIEPWTFVFALFVLASQARLPAFMRLKVLVVFTSCPSSHQGGSSERRLAFEDLHCVHMSNKSTATYATSSANCEMT